MNIAAKYTCQGCVGLYVYYMSVGALYEGMLGESHFQLTGSSGLDMLNLDT